MILIGENIHIISKSVRNALITKDEEFIKNLVKQQNNVDYADLNIGPARGFEEDTLSWLVNIVQEYSNLGISFDTTNTTAMKKGLEASKNPQESFINSTSNDEPRLTEMTNLAAEFGCNLIALTLNKETGIPKTADGRLEIAFEIYERCVEKGIGESKIFFDPLVLPVGVDQSQGVEVLNTIKMIKESFDPPVSTIIGLSNISNGSPEELRPLINRVFAVLAYGAGVDAAIIDAKDGELIRILRMLESNTPQNKTDEIYINLVQSIRQASDVREVEIIPDNEIIKTAQVLLNKVIYSHSFTQI